jgi:hypothetical protein
MNANVSEEHPASVIAIKIIFNLKMDTRFSFETLVSSFMTSQCHNSVDNNPKNHRRSNLKIMLLL